jgi:Glycosyltransferase like family 2
LQPYTLVTTSCGRFDLLEETLRSFYSHVDVAPQELIVVEDSADEQVRKVVDSLGVPARTLVNGDRLGQMRAIDRAYAQVSTPLVFHCEDDWLFTRGGFIRESAALLKALDDVSMVGLRPRSELNPLVRASPVEQLGDIAYFRMDPKLHPEYFSHSFNPGLRRLADYARLGPYAPLGHEADVSYAFKRAGFRIANLEIPAVRHLGAGRHIPDPTQRPRARTALQRLQRSVRKRFKRLRRAADQWR